MTQMPKKTLQPDPDAALPVAAEKLGPDLTDADVFRSSTSRITLAQVLVSAEAALTGTALRDTRSAFATLARAGVDLAGIVATPSIVRSVLDALTPGRLSMSEKRLANIRSLVTKAVERFGQRRTWVTKEIPLSPAWEALLGQVADQQLRWGLGRLACFCTVKDIAPQEVTVETLRGLFAALEAEEMVKDPKNLLKHTIAIWNMCHTRVPGWPEVRLSSPFKTAPAMLPLESFPLSFQADVSAWEARMRHPDPLDPAAPVRPLREPTLEGYRFTFRRLASALVRSGVVLEEITGLGVLVEPEHFKAGLREYLPKPGSGRTADYAHKMAVQMLTVARMHLRFDETQLKPLQAIADKLKPQGGRRMGERNRAPRAVRRPGRGAAPAPLS